MSNNNTIDVLSPLNKEVKSLVTVYDLNKSLFQFDCSDGIRLYPRKDFGRMGLFPAAYIVDDDISFSRQTCDNFHQYVLSGIIPKNTVEFFNLLVIMSYFGRNSDEKLKYLAKTRFGFHPMKVENWYRLKNEFTPDRSIKKLRYLVDIIFDLDEAGILDIENDIPMSDSRIEEYFTNKEKELSRKK